MLLTRNVVIAMIDFSPLWETMREKGITQYKLLKDGVLDNRLLSALKHNRNVTLLTLAPLCKALNCTLDEIVRFSDLDE